MVAKRKPAKKASVKRAAPKKVAPKKAAPKKKVVKPIPPGYHSLDMEANGPGSGRQMSGARRCWTTGSGSASIGRIESREQLSWSARL